MSRKSALVYSCCGVASWGYLHEPCWACGLGGARDAWMDAHNSDYDATMARKYTTLTDIKPKKTLI